MNAQIKSDLKKDKLYVKAAQGPKSNIGPAKKVPKYM